MQGLLYLARNHAARVAEFLVALGGLWGIVLLQQDLANGTIEVPSAWNPEIPLILMVATAAFALLMPQAVRLRAAALAPDPHDPQLSGVAEQIAQGITSALNALPLPSAPVTSSAPAAELADHPVAKPTVAAAESVSVSLTTAAGPAAAPTSPPTS